LQEPTTEWSVEPVLSRRDFMAWNGGTYHYYACSGRQKLGRRSCDGE
jgi:hypothetical protein